MALVSFCNKTPQLKYQKQGTIYQKYRVRWNERNTSIWSGSCLESVYSIGKSQTKNLLIAKLSTVGLHHFGALPSCGNNISTQIRLILLSS